MRAKPRKQPQGVFLCPDLLGQLDPKHPLRHLAARVPWNRFEVEFPALYRDQGRPAKPTRLMVGLMLLNQLEKLSTMAGALIRELSRKLPNEAPACHQERLDLFERVRNQKRSDKNEIYSLHEPDILCIPRGKAHKQYAFGRKASVAVTETAGIIGAMSFNESVYDGHTLPDVLEP